MTKREIEFTTRDFIDREKDVFWYVGIGLLLGVGLYITYRVGDFLLALVVIAAGIAIFRLSNLKSEEKKVVVNEKGIIWGERFFGYHKIRSYWFAASGEQVMLYLDRLNFNPTLIIPVSSVNLDQLDGYLGSRLPHHDHKNEPFSERIARFFRL